MKIEQLLVCSVESIQLLKTRKLLYMVVSAFKQAICPIASWFIKYNTGV